MYQNEQMNFYEERKKKHERISWNNFDVNNVWVHKKIGWSLKDHNFHTSISTFNISKIGDLIFLKLFQNWLLKVEFKYEHYDIELNNSFSTPNKRGGNCEKIVNQEI
jgi:hypothetical protein